MKPVLGDDRLLIPNIAAEEGAIWRRAGGEEVVRTLVRLWRLLFGPGAELLGAAPRPIAELWPGALGSPPGGSLLPRLEGFGSAVAWLNTAEALQIAEENDRVLAGAAPEVVRRVHDKAFAFEVADREGLLPRELAEAIAVFDPGELDDPAAIDARIAIWPAWMQRRFALKPRFGSSGRGRVSSAEALPGALARLAERGGAILEPWLDRIADLSAQLWIEPDRSLRLLGTLELLVSPSGVFRGHRGTIDNKGRVTSGLDGDEGLREAAAILGSAAAAEGYWGPCGVDAFCYEAEGGSRAFRPVVEFNARFTVGTVIVGLLRAALPLLRAELPCDAGERRGFFFSLDAPPNGWPEVAGDPELVFLPLGSPGETLRPGLLVAATPERLETAVPDDSSQGVPVPSIISDKIH